MVVVFMVFETTIILFHTYLIISLKHIIEEKYLNICITICNLLKIV